jgi:tetratricopeptide (TPR) repeat protein
MEFLKRSLLVILLLSSLQGTEVFGDEALAVRQKAKPLIAQKRYAEAIAYYEEMAGKTADKDNNATFLKEASKITLDKLKDFDQAMLLAKKIQDPGYSKSRQLVLLQENNQVKQAIEQFGEADINSWPFNCRLESFLSRGRAYIELKNLSSAKEDLIQASEGFGSVMNKGQSCKLLGDLYWKQLKDDEKALIAYRKGMDVTKANYSWRSDCFLNVINILLKQNKGDEARSTFESFDFDKLPNGQTKCRFYLAYADVLIEQNYNGQAATQLIKILQMGEVSVTMKKRANEKLKALIEDMKNPQVSKASPQ